MERIRKKQNEENMFFFPPRVFNTQKTYPSFKRHVWIVTLHEMS